MKAFWKDLLYSCIMGLIIPGMILSVGVAMFDTDALPEEPTVAQIRQESPQLMIPVLTESGVEEMVLDDYLTGVVLAEMPVSFEFEAQKAQAVVARTYTVRAYRGKSKHENAAVCTDSACCQGYVSQADYLAKGGSQEGIDRIREAVRETSGYVLTFKGELIEATYFSCSGGTTEDAVAVWGTDVPYLRSVSSPGEEEATHYTDSISFTVAELENALSIELEGDGSGWFSDVTYTSGGGVASVTIGGKAFAGTELRRLLGLRSTAFSVETANGTITFTTRGYGHRVGMSQYGADAMAASGSGYWEILSHYYQGTVLEQLTD